MGKGGEGGRGLTMMVIRIKRTTETRPILTPCERRGENLVAF